MKLNNKIVLLSVVVAALGGGVALVSAPQKLFRTNDKAFYLDERTVNFVRPGLQFQVAKATIAADGTLQVQFKISDPRGLPLDREGITTPGTVASSFVVARIPQDSKWYLSYTTRTQVSPITGKSAVQAGADTGGRYERLAEGEYLYTFGTKLPTTFDRAATHTVHIYGSRNLSEFDLGTNYADTVFTWVPSGAAVTKVRDIVKSATCNQCHTQLGLHGGSRRSVEGCIVCHQPQTTDPDTGNSVDMTEMIHKIHMGAQLPSVQAGGKYCIVGNAQTEHCYGKVVFPPGANNCESCHNTALTGTAKPAQVDAHLKNPSRAACGSCHDNVNFQTGLNHVNLPQPNDNQCSTCHIPKGEFDFDASIIGAHVTPTAAAELPGTVFAIESIADGVAGRRPRVTFTIKDKSGAVIPANRMNALSLVLAGPTADYASYVSEPAAAAAQDLGGGRYAYTFNATIPADATGSYTVGMEGYRNVTLQPGTTIEQVVRDAGTNVQRTFAVDNKPVVNRRQVVAIEKCNACHGKLTAHGFNRNTIGECVLCHTPNQTDANRRPAAAGPPESVHFATMIHRIHSGAEQTRKYSIFGFGSNEIDFSEVEFPGRLATCAGCHVNNSQRLPLGENLLPVNDPRGYNPKPGPEAAACTSCHASRAAAAHAVANTNAIGESCATCHGPNADFAVDKVHAQ